MIKGYSLLNIILFLLIPLFSQGNFITEPQKESQGFWENQGQIHNEFKEPRPDVKFIWSDNDYKLILKNTGFSYELFSLEKSDSIQDNSTNKYKFHRVDIEFVNSQIPVILKEGPSENFNNYYKGRTSIANKVRNYSNVIYKNIYDKIDLIFNIVDGKPKYDFILYPGSNINSIKLKYKGAEKTTLVSNEIIIKTSLGNIIESIPISFQYCGNTKQEKNVRYILKDGILSFKCLDYDENKIMVIDPVPSLMWRKTYPATPESNGIDTDSKNNIIITGTAWNTSLIATSGTFQSSYNGGDGDAFIMKCNSNGTELWGTFYGGSDADIGLDVAIDTNDDIIISGKTLSTDLPVPGAYQSNYGGGIWYDAFVSKFNSSGSLIWGTYYGASGDEEARAVVTDSKNNIVVCGIYNRTPFVAKFTKAGTKIWSAISGLYTDEGNDVAVDDADNIFFVGYTRKTSNFTTPGSYQESYGGGDSDGFLIKYDINGTIIWSTYYGGISGDIIYRVMIDKKSNILIGGITGGYNNIVTSGAFQTTNVPGDETGFYVKFNSAGIRQWGTYYGEYARIFGMDSDSSGNYFFTGEGQGPDLPFPIPYYAGSPSYISGFDSLGQRFWNTMVYSINSTTLKERDDSFDLAIDKEGNILITGKRFHEFYDLHDIFISKYGYCPGITPHITSSGSSIKCQEDSIMLSAPPSSSYHWQNGDSTQSIYAKTAGYYYVTTTNNKGCSYNSDTVTVTNKLINPAINQIDSLICPGKKICLVSDTAATNLLWSTGETSDSIYVNTSGKISLQYKINGCAGKDSVNIQSFSAQKIIFYQDTLLCPNSSLLLHSSSLIDSLEWSTGGTSDSIYINIPGIYHANGYFNKCPVYDSVSIAAVLPQNIYIGKDTSLCEGQSIYAGVNLSGVTYKWSTKESSPYITIISSGDYYVDIFQDGCKVGSDTIVVEQKNKIQYYIPNLITSNDDDKNEEFKIQGLLPETTIMIYNVWGSAVYKSNDYKNNWPPENISSGLYYYHISNTNKCSSEASGWLQIIK